MSLDQLLIHVSQVLGIPDLSTNGNGVCQFSSDEGVVVSIEDAPLESSAHIYATIAHAPDAGSEGLFAALLEAQLFGREIGEGMAFGLERSTTEILLCRKMRIDGVEPDTFGLALSEFIAWAEHWQNKLTDMSSSSTSSHESDSDLPSHFIRA